MTELTLEAILNLHDNGVVDLDNDAPEIILKDIYRANVEWQDPKYLIKAYEILHAILGDEFVMPPETQNDFYYIARMTENHSWEAFNVWWPRVESLYPTNISEIGRYQRFNDYYMLVFDNRSDAEKVAKWLEEKLSVSRSLSFLSRAIEVEPIHISDSAFRLSIPMEAEINGQTIPYKIILKKRD